MAETIIFYMAAAVVLVSAVLMAVSRNIMHSALYLALTLLGTAAVFVLLNSYFVAGIQVLLYIGAVVVLTIFVISLTREITGKSEAQLNSQVLPAFLTAAAAAGLIILAVLKTDWHSRAPSKTALDNTADIGRLFLTDFVIPFEAVSVLLLAALIGAVVIISSGKEGKK